MIIKTYQMCASGHCPSRVCDPLDKLTAQMGPSACLICQHMCIYPLCPQICIMELALAYLYHPIHVPEREIFISIKKHKSFMLLRSSICLCSLNSHETVD